MNSGKLRYERYLTNYTPLPNSAKLQCEPSRNIVKSLESMFQSLVGLKRDDDDESGPPQVLKRITSDLLSLKQPCICFFRVQHRRKLLLFDPFYIYDQSRT